MHVIWSRRFGFKETEPDRSPAMARARQLATEYPGERFHVLEGITSVCCAADALPVLSHVLPVVAEEKASS